MKNNDINFEYIEDFADYIVEKTEMDEDLYVTIVGKFEEIKDVIKEIMSVSEVDFEVLNLQSPDVNNYTDEYILYCWCDYDVVQLGCEPAKQNNSYSGLAGDEIYIFGDCNSKIIPLCECSDLYFVNIEDECDCDECCPCDCHCGDTEIAKTEESSYKINDKPVSKQEFDKKYKELHEKYEKSMRGILNDYCDFMDEFNTFFPRLW